MSFDDDALSNILSSRRIPHSRAGKKGSSQQTFDPLTAVGTYEILCKADGLDRNTASSITVHGLTEDNSTLIVRLIIGNVVDAIGILAGSRKVMKAKVDELEADHDQNESSDESGGDNPDAMGTGSDDQSREEPDDMHNRRVATFEKNSFRNPKFWLCWRGVVRKNGEGASIGEKNFGYLIWKNNRCEQFEGTISCDALGWKNVKIKGHRTRKGASECHLNWTDVELSQES